MALQLCVCQIPVAQTEDEVLRALGKAAANMPQACAAEGQDEVRGLALLPELFHGGFDYPAREAWAARTPALLRTLMDYSRETRIAVAGTLWEAADDVFYNTMYMVDPTQGAPTVVHRKQHLFPSTQEEQYFQAGPQPPQVYELGGVRLGFAICFEIRFPELFRIQNAGGVDCFVVSSQWPLKRLIHIMPLLRARAIENQCFVLSCNACGPTPLGDMAGHSRLISPWGAELFACVDEEDVRGALFERSMLERARRLFDSRRSPLYPVTRAKDAGAA